MGTFHCSQKWPSHVPTQVAHLTSALATRAALYSETALVRDCCISTGSTQAVICPTTVTCFAHPPITEQPSTQPHCTKGAQPYPGCTRGSNYAMLLSAQHTPHYSSLHATYTTGAILFLYNLNSSSCILDDYYSKSEWKFGKEYY